MCSPGNAFQFLACNLWATKLTVLFILTHSPVILNASRMINLLNVKWCTPYGAFNSEFLGCFFFSLPLNYNSFSCLWMAAAHQWTRIAHTRRKNWAYKVENVSNVTCTKPPTTCGILFRHRNLRTLQKISSSNTYLRSWFLQVLATEIIFWIVRYQLHFQLFLESYLQFKLKLCGNGWLAGFQSG